jgi:hypothetical protein
VQRFPQQTALPPDEVAELRDRNQKNPVTPIEMPEARAAPNSDCCGTDPDKVRDFIDSQLIVGECAGFVQQLQGLLDQSCLGKAGRGPDQLVGVRGLSAAGHHPMSANLALLRAL